MQKISTHLWFDTQAKEAAGFYVSLFGNGSRIKSSNVLNDTPSGSVDMLTIDLLGQEFALISAGPLFTFTPAISFLVACQTPEEVERLWNGMVDGGKVLMELGSYPFSAKYGWIQDKFGLSWQFMLTDVHVMKQTITPTLMFVGDVCGKAEEAMNFYASVFKDAKVGDLMRYGSEEGPDKEGTVKHGGFMLEGMWFAAMDSAHTHAFTFNEAISFIVHCETQEEIDYYWGKLSAVPRAEQCGWLKDKYGVSWQISPTVMEAVLNEGDTAKIARVTQAFLKMKKFDIAELQKAADGN